MKAPMKWYRPRQIAKLGLIVNSKGSDKENSNYIFILGLIKNGKLQAKDYSQTDRPYYMVPETAIKKYHKKFNKV